MLCVQFMLLNLHIDPKTDHYLLFVSEGACVLYIVETAALYIIIIMIYIYIDIDIGAL